MYKLYRNIIAVARIRTRQQFPQSSPHAQAIGQAIDYLDVVDRKP